MTQNKPLVENVDFLVEALITQANRVQTTATYDLERAVTLASELVTAATRVSLTLQKASANEYWKLNA